MNPVNKMKALKGAVALAAILAMTGSAIAKKNKGGGGIEAVLSPERDSVTLSITPQCQQSTTIGATVSADYSVYIFQSVGRLINIGIATGTLPCGSTTPVDVTVDAIDGLTFQPGPATMIMKFTTLETTNPTPGTTTENQVGIPIESGARINLH